MNDEDFSWHVGLAVKLGSCILFSLLSICVSVFLWDCFAPASLRWLAEDQRASLSTVVLVVAVVATIRILARVVEKDLTKLGEKNA